MSKMPKPTTIDFEGFGIEGRPAYPPVPVGVSIKPWGKKARYYSWGHVTGGNNCTKADAVAALRAAYSNPDGILCHHGKFDLDVAETHLGLPFPAWSQVHETMFLLFLNDPHQMRLDLKSSAHRLLGMPPEEQDAVVEWLVTNQPVEGVKITRAKGGKEPAGKYIAYAPGTVVGPYANGDTDRTERLFNLLYPKIVEAGMLEAYDRERRLVPIFLDMERTGVRVDLPRLRRDVRSYNDILAKLESLVRSRLGVADDFNIDSGQALVAALVAAGVADTSLMGVTKTGKVKADKAALAVGCSDKPLAAILKYMTQLKTCLRTFMEPWLRTAEASGGLIFTNWNQIKSPDGGARTGRLSSSPNFQNIPKEFDFIFRHEAVAFNKTVPAAQRLDLNKYPEAPWKLPPLPLCRSYIVPLKEGHVLVGRDYSQQEPRILAHFEGGALQDQYNENPWIDFHDNAKDNLERIFRRTFKRKPVKNINLGLIYGQGVPSLAAKNGETVADTQMLKDAILKMYPGLDTMYKDMKFRARTNQPIRTWGGRVYFCEPARIIDNRIRVFDYKMVNVLIQGSAADCTKEAMIRFYNQAADAERRVAKVEAGLTTICKKRGWHMILQVHDEIVLSVPAKDLALAQETLRKAMESVEFDVQILSEGAWSANNWAVMADWDKKGKRIANDQQPKGKVA